MACVLILLSKENPKYNQLRLITFLIGISVIIFSETTIRFISNISLQNIFLSVLPIISFILIYSYLFYKFKLSFKKSF